MIGKSLKKYAVSQGLTIDQGVASVSYTHLGMKAEGARGPKYMKIRRKVT